MAYAKNSIESKFNKEISSFYKKSILPISNNSSIKNLTFDEFLSDRMLIIYAIRVGIPYHLFELIKTWTPFNEEEWTNFLEVSSKTMQRYKKYVNHHFKMSHSEKIIEMAEVTKMGLDVFGEMDKFKNWVNTPNQALGRQKPIDLLTDSYGKELVISELVRIEHGILA